MVKNFTLDFLINVFRKLAVSVVFIGSLKLYTNSLTPVQYGNYSIIFFLTSIFSLVSSSWLSATYIRFHFQHSNHVSFFNSLFNLQVIVSIVSSIVLGLILKILNVVEILELDYTIIFIITLNFFFLSSFNLLSSFYTASRKLKKIGIASVIQAFLLLGLSYFFFKIQVHEKVIFIASLFSYSIICIFLFIDIFGRTYKFHIRKEYLTGIFKYGGPLLLMSIFSFLLISGDQLLMKFLGLNKSVGIYSANYTLIDKTVTLFTSIFTVSYTPILFSLWERGDRLKTYEFYKKAVFIYAIVITILSVFILLFYKYFAEFVINSMYINVEMLIYILGGTLFFNLTNIISEIYTLNKNTKLFALCFIFPLLLNFGGNLIFLPKIGVMAAAYFTLISYFSLFLITLAVAKKKFF